MQVTQKRQAKRGVSKLRRRKRTKRQLSQQKQSDRIQCCYINSTAQFQIVRIVTSRFLERVVMPQATFIFEAHRDDHLEIHTGNPISSILSDKIPCHCLAYEEKSLR